MAEAIFIIGSQSGSVILVIKTSPSSKEVISLGSKIILALPVLILLPTDDPFTISTPLSSLIYSLIMEKFLSAWIVSGLAWIIYNLPSEPSFAHSISIGVHLPFLLL